MIRPRSLALHPIAVAIVVAPVLACAFAITHAVAATPAPRLTWEESIRRASAANPELESARAKLRSADELHKAAWGPFLPQVTGAMGYSYGTSSTSAASGSTFPATTTKSTTAYSATLSATENLFNGWVDRARLAQTAANFDAQAASLASTRAKVSNDLKSAFAGLSYSQDLVKLTQEFIDRRDRNEKLVELRFEAGRENKGSVLLSRAYLAQAKLDHLQAVNAVTTARSAMLLVIGETPEGSASLEGDTIEVAGAVPISEPGPELGVAKLQELALSTPTHLQAVAESESSDAAVAVSRGTFLPTLSVTGQVGRQGSEFFPENDRWSISANLALPIFSGFKDYHNLKSTIAERESSNANLIHADLDLLSRLRAARATYVEAVEKMKVDLAFLEAARTRADIARNKYNNGLLSFEDWDLIENDLITRERQSLTSRRDRVTAEAAWEQTVGKGIIE